MINVFYVVALISVSLVAGCKLSGSEAKSLGKWKD